MVKITDNTRGGSQDAANPLIATDEVTYSGDTADVQLLRPVHVTGSEGSRTVVDVTSAEGVLASVGPGFARTTTNDTLSSVVAGASFNVDGCSTVAFAITGTYSATIVFQLSWDGTTFTTVPALIPSSGTEISSAVGITATCVMSTRGARLFRVNMTAYTSGTATVAKSAQPWPAFQMIVGDNKHDSIDHADSYPVKIGGVAQDAAPSAVADNDRVQAWFMRNGQQVVSLVRSDGARIATDDGSTDNYNPTGQAGILTVQFPYAYDGATWDRQRSVEAVSAAPNVDTGIPATGIGPGFDRKTNPTGVAANSTSNAVEVLVNGADAIIFHVTTIGTTPGSMIFQNSTDDSAWSTSGAVLKLNGESWIEGSFVPAVDDVYMVRCAGMRRVRYKVNAAYASGTATVKITSVLGTPIVKAVEIAGAPHKTGYTTWFAGADISSSTTTNIKTPTSGKKLVTTKITLGTGSTTAGLVTVWYAASGDTTVNLNTDDVLFRGVLTPTANATPGAILDFPVNAPVGTTDYLLKVTTGAAITLYVTAHGYEIT